MNFKLALRGNPWLAALAFFLTALFVQAGFGGFGLINMLISLAIGFWAYRSTTPYRP